MTKWNDANEFDCVTWFYLLSSKAIVSHEVVTIFFSVSLGMQFSGRIGRNIHSYSDWLRGWHGELNRVWNSFCYVYAKMWANTVTVCKKTPPRNSLLGQRNGQQTHKVNGILDAGDLDFSLTLTEKSLLTVLCLMIAF